MGEIREYDVADLSVKRVMVLSAEEFDYNKALIKPMGENESWWTRTPSPLYEVAAFVSTYGNYVDYYVGDVEDPFDVRPAMVLYPKEGNPAAGEEFIYVGEPWTMLHDNIAVCDRLIGEYPFKDMYAEDYDTEKVNRWKYSDLKKYVEKWGKSKGIRCKATLRIDISPYIESVTVPSVEEYEKNKEIIPEIHDNPHGWYWTRSKGDAECTAAVIMADGKIRRDFDVFMTGAVRPMIILKHGIKDAEPGSVFEYRGFEWTLGYNNLVFCNSTVGRCLFCEGTWDGTIKAMRFFTCADKKANDWDISGLKCYVEIWGSRHRINKSEHNGLSVNKEMTVDRVMDGIITVESIGLVTVDEYNRDRNVISHIKEYYLLKQDGVSKEYLAMVEQYGHVHIDEWTGEKDERVGVRPCITLIKNKANPKPGQFFSMGGLTWSMGFGRRAYMNGIISDEGFIKELKYNEKAPKKNGWIWDISRRLNLWAKSKGIFDYKVHMACGFPFRGREEQIMLKIKEIAENELGGLPNLEECDGIGKRIQYPGIRVARIVGLMRQQVGFYEGRKKLFGQEEDDM
ncbi:MAG: hypothetical protein K6G24_12875 [Lachnospiraceae bacterium]|nr:hypothetical protein [Lachnospiraceae bacterium]